MKLTIKDIYSSDNEEQPIENNEPKASLQENRMISLNKSLNQKDVVLKKETIKWVDESKLKEEAERMKTLSQNKLNEFNQVNRLAAHVPGVLGMGKSVNSIMDNSNGKSVNTFMDMNLNPNSLKVHNPNYTYLSDGEALRLSISRALNSGDPTATQLGFYEEINQVLNGLGFGAKSPLDIKQMILKMMRD